MRLHSLFGSLALCGVPLTIAHAVDVDPFRPSGSILHGQGTLQGEAPWVGENGPGGGVLTYMAQDLAVLDFSDDTTEDVVGNALTTTFYGSYTLARRARIEAFVPLYAHAEAPLSDFQGFALGDIRIQSNVYLWGLDNNLFSISVIPYLGIPTGSQANYLGRGIHGGLTAALGGEFDFGLGWVVNLGGDVAPASTLANITFGSNLQGLAGTWYQIDDSLRVGGEIQGDVGIARQDGTSRQTMMTGHVYLQAQTPLGFALTVGGGSGIGVGAPAYRLFAGFSYAPAPRDKDRDGRANNDDVCPMDPEDLDGFEDEDGCPDLDNDGDLLPDTSDACPLEAEDVDGFDDTDGCPDLDNDEDGLPDSEDECPDDAGAANLGGCPDADGDGIGGSKDACPDAAGSLDTRGCPDSDDDGIGDADDACPAEPAPADAHPDFSTGCTDLTYVNRDGKIVLAEKIRFEDPSTIAAESTSLLDSVAELMLQHPEILLLEVQGHTDNSREPQESLDISHQRAEATAIYLTTKGIPHKRLTPRGYGQDRPVDTNRTSAGRSHNERIEFAIVKLATEETTAPPPRPKSAPDTSEDAENEGDTTEAPDTREAASRPTHATEDTERDQVEVTTPADDGEPPSPDDQDATVPGDDQDATVPGDDQDATVPGDDQGDETEGPTPSDDDGDALPDDPDVETPEGGETVDDPTDEAVDDAAAPEEAIREGETTTPESEKKGRKKKGRKHSSEADTTP